MHQLNNTESKASISNINNIHSAWEADENANKGKEKE